MGVTVDSKAVLKHWRQRDQDSVLAVWRPPGSSGLGEGDALVRAASAAVESANRALAESGPTTPPAGVHGWEPWMGPHGPVLYVKPADTSEALGTWLAEVAAALGREGWEGRIEPDRGQSPPVISDPKPVLTAVLCFDGWGTNARGRAVSPWSIDGSLRDRLADWAVEWSAVSRDELYLSQGPGRFAMPPAAVRDGIRRRPDESQIIWNPDIGRMRSVTFTWSGRLLVQLRDTSAPWRHLVDELRRLLAVYAADCSLGLVRYSFSNKYTADRVLNGWPPKLPRSPAFDTPVNYYIFHRNRDDELVPDASGIQLLSDGHLSRIKDLTRWSVATVAPGRHLVEAPDLAPWYENDQPDPDVLAAAREDFADAILWSEPR